MPSYLEKTRMLQGPLWRDDTASTLDERLRFKALSKRADNTDDEALFAAELTEEHKEFIDTAYKRFYGGGD